MFRRILALILASIVFFLAGCSKTDQRTPFFAWMDAYIALPVQSSFQLALTMFYEKSHPPFAPDDITNLAFDGLEEKVTISSFHIESKDYGPKSEYSSYDITIDFQGVEIGLYKTRNLVLFLTQSNSVILPIGTWKFDIDISESSQEFIDVGGSPVASTNSQEYVYSYSSIKPDAKLIGVQYGSDLFLEDVKGLPLSGNIPLTSYKSPITYIKAKLKIQYAGNTYIAYDNGCYCGALNVTNKVIDSSRQYGIDNKVA